MDSFAPNVASLRPFFFWELRSILRNGTAWQQPARTLHEQQNGRWHVMCQQGLRWLRATAGSIPGGLPLAATPHAWAFLWANGQLDRARPTPRNSSSIGNAPNLGTEGLDSTVTRDGPILTWLLLSHFTCKRTLKNLVRKLNEETEIRRQKRVPCALWQSQSFTICQKDCAFLVRSFSDGPTG